MTDYYIVAGVVYQAPDLGTLLNSRYVTRVSDPNFYFTGPDLDPAF